MNMRQHKNGTVIYRRHFIKLHESVAEHAGIIVCTQDVDIAGQAQRIHEAIVIADTLENKLLRIRRLQG